jgi:hypothetical protein
MNHTAPLCQTWEAARGVSNKNNKKNNNLSINCFLEDGTLDGWKCWK